MTEEDAFQQAIRDDEDDDATRQVYADWLEERGDPRGEFLRLEMQLHACKRKGKKYQAIRERLLELGQNIDAVWLAIVSRPRLLGSRHKDKRGYYTVDYLEDGCFEYLPDSPPSFFHCAWKQIADHITMSWKFKQKDETVVVHCEGSITKREIKAKAWSRQTRRQSWDWIFFRQKTPLPK